MDSCNPYAIAKGIAGNLKMRRLELNLSQQSLADKSGVSLGTLKRFENRFEISLKHLLMLAVAMDASDEFIPLFSKRKYESIDEVINTKEVKKRLRGKRHVRVH
jgi:transcriptional regulator with XRE-family HTH domain